MKRLLLLLLAFFTLLQLQAQSQLRVTTTDHTPIKLAIDGRYFKRHGHTLTVGNIPAGKHWIEVFVYRPDNENARRNYKIYEGRVKIHRDEVATCVINAQTGDIDITRAPAGTSNYAPTGDDDVYGNNNRNNMPQDTTAISPAANTNTITNEELNKLGKKVAEKLTDTEKMKKMKAGLNGKSVSTAQVATMMAWLNFETTRLDFAEWVYDNVVDKEHYKELESKFNFSSTKQKLEEYINSKK